DLFLDKKFAVVEEEIRAVLEETESDQAPRKDVGFIKHICYTLLGLVAFEEENIDQASKYLIESIHVPESPVLKTFGASMLLAYKLSRIGDNKNVELFLVECKKAAAWWYIPLLFKLSKWISSLKKGQKPQFEKNIYLHFAIDKNLLERLENYAPL
ncbi:MAG: hypothetical protein AAFY48_19165, partial [Bacteroidota bacterium]